MEELYAKILVFLQFLIIGLMVLLSKGISASFFPIIIFIMGSLIGIWALFYNRIGNFNIQPILKDNASLITTGIYKYIRHPMYLSVLIIMFDFLLSNPILWEITLFIFLTIVLFLKAKKEESLWLESDEEYIHYKSNTKLIFPFLL